MTLLRPKAQKSLPRTPSDFLHQALVYIGLLEYRSKIDKNCSPPIKQRRLKTIQKKYLSTSKKIELFLLVSNAKFLEVNGKKVNRKNTF
jgi:hypothetical protein